MSCYGAMLPIKNYLIKKCQCVSKTKDGTYSRTAISIYKAMAYNACSSSNTVTSATIFVNSLVFGMNQWIVFQTFLLICQGLLLESGAPQLLPPHIHHSLGEKKPIQCWRAVNHSRYYSTSQMSALSMATLLHPSFDLLCKHGSNPSTCEGNINMACSEHLHKRWWKTHKLQPMGLFNISLNTPDPPPSLNYNSSGHKWICKNGLCRLPVSLWRRPSYQFYKIGEFSGSDGCFTSGGLQAWLKGSVPAAAQGAIRVQKLFKIFQIFSDCLL